MSTTSPIIQNAPERPYDDFALAVRHARIKRDLTQAQLAQLVDATRVTVARWESGYQRPAEGYVRILERELGIKLLHLLPDTRAAIGDALRAARIRRRLTKVKLAELVDLSRETIGRYERDEVFPSMMILARLEAVLGTRLVQRARNFNHLAASAAELEQTRIAKLRGHLVDVVNDITDETFLTWLIERATSYATRHPEQREQRLNEQPAVAV